MAAKARDIMEVHHMLAHPSEEITRQTAEAMNVPGNHEGVFSATGVKRIASQGAVVAAKTRDIMEVHHMLAHPSEEITRQTTEVMGITTTGQWEAYEAFLQAKSKRFAVPKMRTK